MAHSPRTEKQAEELYYQLEDRVLKLADTLEEIHWHGGTFQAIEQILELKATGRSQTGDELAASLEEILVDLRATYETSDISGAERSLGNLLCHNLMMMAFESWERVFTELLPNLSKGDNEEALLDEAETACRLMDNEGRFKMKTSDLFDTMRDYTRLARW